MLDPFLEWVLKPKGINNFGYRLHHYYNKGRRRNGVFQDCLVIGEAPFPYLWTSMALNMLQKRTLASCCVLNQGRTLWITGGEDGDFALNTTEFITLEENPVIGPELPFTIRF